MKTLLLNIIFVCGSFLSYGQEISPYLVGSNYWYQLDQKAEVMSLVANSGMKTIRIGGNGYNKGMPSNASLAPWVNQIKEMGMEPVMQVSAFKSAADAASVVQYFNIDTNNPIKFWAIGNEPALHQDFTAEEVYEYSIGYATAMKAVDPSIIIFVPDLAWINFQYLDRFIGGDLDMTGLKLEGTETYIIDGFTWHRYPLVGDPYTRANAVNVRDTDLRNPATRLVESMENADALHGRVGDDKLKWGIGEFNINVGMNYGTTELFRTVEGIGTNSFLNGQFFAEVFDLSMELGATFAASWSIHESGGARGPGDLGLINGPDDDPNPRSNFYHSQMVSENIYGSYLNVAANENLVSAFGGVHPDNTFSIMVLNKEENTGYDFSLHMNESTIDEKPLQLNASLGMDITFEGFIPAQATMVFTFSESGELTEKIIYTLAHAQDFLAPTVLTPGEDTVIVNLSKNVGTGCLDTPITFSTYQTIGSDSVVWNFGSDASPASYTGYAPVEISYSVEGSKSVELLVFKDGESVTFTFEDFITINACTQSSYQGNKQQIPGTIESVYYDEGGQNIAYFDTDPDENKDEGIRQDEGVDTGLGDIENGAGNLGWLEAGEWVEYTIDVEETGTYKLEIRHASLVGGGQFRLLFDGEDKTGAITTPATPGWYDFEGMTVSDIDLEAGQDVVMRLEILQGAFNLGTLSFESESLINSVSDKLTEERKFIIYPNPASSNLFIRKASTGGFTYEIIGLTGMQLMKGGLTGNLNEISVDNLRSGTYIIRLISELGQSAELFFKD